MFEEGFVAFRAYKVEFKVKKEEVLFEVVM